jgi:hypothetical protein
MRVASWMLPDRGWGWLRFFPTMGTIAGAADPRHIARVRLANRISVSCPMLRVL